MESDKLIEAMALSMANLDCRRFDCPELGSVDEFRYEDDYRDYVERATAAFKALRDTLEPVAYVVHRHSGYSELNRKPSVNDEERGKGWTETPLFALPEVKP